ncbi:MAG: RluA family pseudouridine synthase [Myxococcota bacterium]
MLARLDALLAERYPEHSRSRLAGLVKAGHVTVDGVVQTRPSLKVRTDAALHVDLPEPDDTGLVAQDLPLRIVFEDADLVVIDKAPGMVVHPGAGNPDGTLVNALMHHIDDLSGIGGELRPGIVHRLDKGTSGLLVVAKNDLAHRHLAAQFADHSAGREYLALCAGTPRERSGRVESFLGRHPKDRVRYTSLDDPERGRLAITHWSVEETLGSITLVRARLETGRTHQVRVHLSELGLPLLGDPLYGKAKPPASVRALVSSDRPLLHAERLHFQHPDGRELQFEAPPAADFQAVLDALRAR